MRRRFKAKRKHIFKFKYVIYILIVYAIYQLSFNFFTRASLTSSNEEFITLMLNDSNHYIKYKNANKNLGSRIIKLITNIDLKNPVTILKNGFYDLSNDELIYDDNYDKLEKKTKYIENPNPNSATNPKVYIYNSHQLENYRMDNLEEYNITPNVLMASYILKEKLESLGIPTIVEETNMTEFMNSNHWQHQDSYTASRYLIKDTLDKYKNLELLIDLHRDAIKYDASTITFDGKKYAKVLFVVGTEYDSYKDNLALANKFNSLINNKYPNLSRGVITKSGSNVNGVYNQDLNAKMLLLECGGYENSIEEVLNTIEALSEIIKIYLEG